MEHINLERFEVRELAEARSSILEDVTEKAAASPSGNAHPRAGLSTGIARSFRFGTGGADCPVASRLAAGPVPGMEPRRALEILRRQPGCDGAGSQRAVACSQPARPAGDPVGIGQFDDLDVVAIRVEHGAGPRASRLPASASQVTPKQSRCRAVARASSTCALMITRAGSAVRAAASSRSSISRLTPPDCKKPSAIHRPVPKVMTCRCPAGRLATVNRSGPGGHVPSPGPVAGAAQYPAQAGNRLGVDVLMRGSFEVFGLRSDSGGDGAIVVLHDRADRLQ